MKTPYLIQRAEIIDGEVTGFDAIVRLDYMGAAEFEFGAIPKSLRALMENLNHLVIHITGVNDICLICNKKDQDAAFDVVDRLAREGDAAYNLHERTELKEALEYKQGDRRTYRTNMWWDIESNWIAVRELRNAERLILALKIVAKKKGITPNP
jgi:hypothetical protein